MTPDLNVARSVSLICVPQLSSPTAHPTEVVHLWDLLDGSMDEGHHQSRVVSVASSRPTEHRGRKISGQVQLERVYVLLHLSAAGNPGQHGTYYVLFGAFRS